MENQEIVKQEESAVTASTFSNVFTTCDLEDRRGKNAILRALNDAESLAQAVKPGDVLEVVDFAVTPGIRRSRQANVPDAECCNVYILTKDGRAFMTQSDGIARSVQQIVALYPNGFRDLEDGCIKLTVRSRELMSGNTVKSLVPVD